MTEIKELVNIVLRRSSHCCRKIFKTILINVDTLNVKQTFTTVSRFTDLKMIICAVYIPPNSDVQILLNYLTVMESIESSYPDCKLIICGNYNIRSSRWVSDKTDFRMYLWLLKIVKKALQ